MIEIKHVTKTYPGQKSPALSDLSLNIESGEFFGLLGPNGAGKTTTIKILAGLLCPDSGTVYIDGQQMTCGAAELKDKVVTVKIKTGEGGKVFGSVSTKEIAAAAKAQLNIDIDKKKLNLQEPIRMVGMVIIPYKVHPKVTAELTVKVEEA